VRVRWGSRRWQHTAASQLNRATSMGHIFGTLASAGCTRRHLRRSQRHHPQLVIECVRKAQAAWHRGELRPNYRPSLWKSSAAPTRARGQPGDAKHVDVMIGNEEDFTACLGFQVEGADEHLLHIERVRLQANE